MKVRHKGAAIARRQARKLAVKVGSWIGFWIGPLLARRGPFWRARRMAVRNFLAERDEGCPAWAAFSGRGLKRRCFRHFAVC